MGTGYGQREHAGDEEAVDLPGGTVQVHFVLLRDSEICQPRAAVERQLLIFDEAHVFKPTELEVGPFLVDLLLLTIDDLFDLLVLGMRFDDPSCSDGLRVAKLGRSSLEVVKDGLDIVGGLDDELVFG